MRSSFCVLLFTIATVHAQQGKPGELLTAPFGPNGTWNLYQPSKSPLSWTKAQEFAAAAPDPAGGSGKMGHLATISTAAENMFVYHYVRGVTIWIGLTDNEKYPGASEAGAAEHRGWAWVTGEPVTYTNWQSSEPSDNDGSPAGKGEDGVAIENAGRWNDRPMGANEQAEQRFPFMIEWDVNSPVPVPGARVIGAVLPEKWPVLEVLPDDEANSGPWVCLQTPQLPGDARLEVLSKHLFDHWTENIPFRMKSINFQMAMGDPSNAFGWIFTPGIDFPGAVTNNFGMLARARLVIPKAGTYTFNVHADDCFAFRLPGQKWKSVHGNGGIDPSDPATIYADLLISDSDTRGVIDLPAGELPVEVFYVNGAVEGLLQIATAEGEFPDDGGTDRWRLLGHKPGAKISWPGISDDGWKVTIPVPGEERKPVAEGEVLTALLRVETADSPVTSGLEVIHFHDPECFRRSRFPGAAPFPGDPAGVQDDRVILAEASLVVPADGTYHIGATGDDICAIQIDGGKWERIVSDRSGRCARMDGDSLSSRRTTASSSQEIIGEIKLAKGNHAIRVMSWDRSGSSCFNVFAAPAGFPPRLLRKAGAGETDDSPGLEVLPFKPDVK